MRQDFAKMMGDLNKKYKADLLVTADADTADIHKIPTGILALDIALGGGFARGRVWENRGAFSAGKSSLALKILGNLQRTNRETGEPLQLWDNQLMVPLSDRLPGEGFNCIWVDTEGHFSKKHAELFGVDTSNLILIQTNESEAALDIIMEMTDTTRAIDLIVLDSIAQLASTEEIEKTMSESSRAQAANTFTKFFKKYGALASDFKSSKGEKGHFPMFLALNQIRDSQNMYAPQPTSPGGKALAHANSLRSKMHVVSKGTIFDAAETSIAQTVCVDFDKNKTGGPRMAVEFMLAMREVNNNTDPRVAAGGTDTTTQIVNMAKRFEYPEVDVSGAWFKYKGEKFQGAANFSRWLLDNPMERVALEKNLLEFVLNRP